MASSNLPSLTALASVATGDLLYAVDDPAGTPLDRKLDVDVLDTYLSQTTKTLTNKTFDANGTGNSLSNVDVADLANGTDGELITWDAAGAPATVAAGTATHVLTSNGAGAAPTFQAAGGGGISEEFRAYKSGAQSVNALSVTEIEFDAEAFDTGNNFNTSTYTYTVPSDGIYYFNYTIGLSSFDADARMQLYIKVGGSNATFAPLTVGGSGTNNASYNASILLDLSTSDAVTFNVFHNGSGAKSVSTGSDGTSQIFGYKLK